MHLNWKRTYFGSGFAQIFGQIITRRGKTLGNTNLVWSRHIKRENFTSGVRYVAPKRLNFNNEAACQCLEDLRWRSWLTGTVTGTNYFTSLLNRFATTLLHCLSSTVVRSLGHNSCEVGSLVVARVASVSVRFWSKERGTSRTRPREKWR